MPLLPRKVVYGRMQSTGINPRFSSISPASLPGLVFGKGMYTHHSFQPHFHDHYVIQVVQEGVCGGHCQRRLFQVASSDILVINPGEVHTGHSVGNKLLVYRSICPSQGFLRDMLKALEFNPDLEPYFTGMQFNNKDISLKFNILLNGIERDAAPLALDTAAVSLFAALLKSHANSVFKFSEDSAPPAAKAALERARTYLCDNFTESFTLRELSLYAGISPAYLSRLFQSTFGLSPWQYLVNYRVERAKSLITRGFSATEAAYQTGFFDPSHFCRHFRRITGATPGNFKKPGRRF